MTLTRAERTAVRILIVVLVLITIVLPYCVPFVRFWRTANTLHAQACAHARSIACSAELATKSPEFNLCKRARETCSESRLVNALADTVDFVGLQPIGRWFVGRSTLTVAALVLVAAGLYTLFATYSTHGPGNALPLPGSMRGDAGKKWA
jgi:hypothetical protein